ncbi:MAG: TspO/MBR family protein [bacterium]
MRKVFILGISLILPYAAGLLGSLATMPAINTWYDSLTKPFFSPPNWVFSPVWIILYLFMGIALYRVWSTETNQPAVRPAIILFLIQLILNALWSILFFGLKSPLLGFIDITVLLVLIAALTIKFQYLDKLAPYLLIPYLYWVSFATVLNFAIWQLN